MKEEWSMNKITRLTEDQYNKLVKTKKLGINLRELLGIPKTKTAPLPLR